MGNARRLLIAVALVVLVALAAGYATGLGRGSDHRSYQDARRLMTRAGFTISNTSPTLAPSWPARFRDHCDAMLFGFYRSSGAETAQTFVCKSPADARALKASLTSGPPPKIISLNGTGGAQVITTRDNLVFNVVADSRAAATAMTQALQSS